MYRPVQGDFKTDKHAPPPTAVAVESDPEFMFARDQCDSDLRAIPGRWITSAGRGSNGLTIHENTRAAVMADMQNPFTVRSDTKFARQQDIAIWTAECMDINKVLPCWDRHPAGVLRQTEGRHFRNVARRL